MTRTKVAFDKLTTAYQAAGANVYANGAVEGEVIEGEVTDKK